MTFDLTVEQQDWARRARELSQEVIASLAQMVDDRGVVPAEIREALSARSLTNPFSAGEISASVVVEEIAAVSAGVATAIGLEWTGASSSGDQPHRDGLPGLRGSSIDVALDRSAPHPERLRLVLCAVAVGVGRASIALAVEAMKLRGVRPSGDEPTPHWTLADAAADLDAARLLVLAAAQILERGEPAETALSMAAGLSARAAERAAEAAGLVVGSHGYRRGSPLERFTRDARTLRLLLGK